MAADCCPEAAGDFMAEKRGRVKDAEPERKAAVRSRFKKYVDNVVSVKVERGVKYVCRKKKFGGSTSASSVSHVTSGPGTAAAHVLKGENFRYQEGGDRIPADDAAEEPAPRAQVQLSPGSGYRHGIQVSAPRGSSAARALPDGPDEDPGEMGNRGSFKRDRSDSKREQVRKTPDIPRIAVIPAPPPRPAGVEVFALSRPVAQVDGAGVHLRDESRLLRVDSLQEPERIHQTGKRSEDGEADGNSWSGSEGNASPKPSRRHFIQVMMDRSPQLRRNMALRNSVRLSPTSDRDALSLVSSNADEDRVTLDPLEHEWMMSSSDGEWDRLRRLLAEEPGLLLRKDFVTGFTCLHWAAKHGRPELLARILDFAEKNGLPASVGVRSNSGYTPLHVAAMHGHMEVVKLLVGAYGADVDIRDYSGRKACQYLTGDVGVDIRDIIGAYEESETENTNRKDKRGWRFPKVLQHHPSGSSEGEVRIRRKSSFSRMKPKLERLRLRTSQIVHSTSFWDKEAQQSPTATSSFRSRPKTHFLG